MTDMRDILIKFQDERVLKPRSKTSNYTYMIHNFVSVKTKAVKKLIFFLLINVNPVESLDYQ